MNYPRGQNCRINALWGQFRGLIQGIDDLSPHDLYLLTLFHTQGFEIAHVGAAAK